MDVGFKEWALVCEALGDGRQSLILRKGGIAEGRAGFLFKHPEFLLFPTLFHEQVSKLKLPPDTALPTLPQDEHSIAYRVVVEWTRDLTDWEQVRRLDPFHLWAEHLIQERFVYEGKHSVSLAFLRVYRLVPTFVFPDAPQYGGCRSWVDLPELPQGTRFVPVLDEEAHRDREAAVLFALGEL
jgi:hypothetical protein